jgi:hypothetical protein
MSISSQLDASEIDMKAEIRFYVDTIGMGEDMIREMIMEKLNSPTFLVTRGILVLRR